MNNSKTYITDVVTAMCGYWPDILSRLGIEIPKNGKHGPCPACGGRDRFRFDDKEGRGTWICNQCGAGDGLALVAKVTGKSLIKAAELISPLVGLSGRTLTITEQNQLYQQQQIKVEKERKLAEQKRQKAAKQAVDIIQSSDKSQSQYLVHKGLGSYLGLVNRNFMQVGNEKFPPGCTVVSLINETNEQVNVQLIRADGVKHYLAGGQKMGAFHLIEGNELIAVVEGYATGLSIHLAIGATIYCAMDCGNLLTVAEMARRRHADSQLLICGDNDSNTQGNPGKTKADQAAIAVCGMMALPPLVNSNNTDWNDYHQAHGLTETKDNLMRQLDRHPKVDPKNLDANQTEIMPFSIEEHVAELPEGFSIRGDTLYAVDWVGRGEDARQEETRISSVIRVLAETADENGGNHGRLLEWQDSSNHIRRWAMPMEALVRRNGEEMIIALLNGGLPFINLEKRRKLVSYLMDSRPSKKITCIERTGWHGSAYVLPTGSIGPDAERVILQTAGYTANDFTEQGTLSEWQINVAGLAVGNSRLCFSISLSFAAPLLSLVGIEGGGFHLKGESTDGKTTIMKAAASVYGHPERYVQTWRATGNAIEGIASRHNDALLCLDELGELDGREAGQTAYMLANGQGKGRSRQDGELRERKSWRLLFLSTGELSLEDHAASAGQRTQAGMEVRTIQIPSHTGHHGAFEQLHGMENGRSFADTLKSNADQQHGTAFRAFIEILALNINLHKRQLLADVKRLVEELTPKGAGNQVGRAINRFALVAAAGELATRLGITGWPEGEALKAIRVCLKAWLTERGHLGNKEDAATLEQVRSFVSAHQLSRFADWNDTNHRPANLVGYRKVDAGEAKFFVLASGWAEITKGRDPKRAAQLCREAGYLQTSNEKNRLQRKVRLPGQSSSASWAYVLTARVLADEADGGED